MSDREIIIPATMQPIVERAGYAPAVRVGDTLYCAGQVGRTPDMAVIHDPEQQFIAAWDNLRAVLSAGGCTFGDVVDMTTYHVGMSQHMALFREVKNRVSRKGYAPGLALVSANWRIRDCWWKSNVWRCGAAKAWRPPLGIHCGFCPTGIGRFSIGRDSRIAGLMAPSGAAAFQLFFSWPRARPWRRRPCWSVPESLLPSCGFSGRNPD